jgi:cytochrome c553
VLTYLDPALEASLKAAGATHPEGAAAVLELYGKRGAVHGWAVSVKTQADSAGGKGWYWYEVLSTEDGSRTLAAEAGAAACVECHGQGRDFVMTAYPPK